MTVGLDMKLSQQKMELVDYIFEWLAELDMKLSQPNTGLVDYIIKWPWALI